MSTFEYRGFDANGRARTGLVEGADAKEARERLLRLGILIEDLASVSSVPRAYRRQGVSPSHRAAFYHESAALLKAGIPLARALQMLIEAPTAGSARVVWARLRDRVAEGAAFHAALGEVVPNVPSFEIAVLEVAEKTGSLGAALEDLADFLDEQQRLRTRVGNALLYPAIVAVAAVLIGGGTLGFLVPRIGAVLNESGIPQPAITRLVVRLGHSMPWIVLVGLIAIGGLIVVERFRPDMREKLRAMGDELALRLPWVGSARNSLASLRFARTLALLLRGSVPLVEALPLAGKATGRRDLAEAALAMAEKVRHGASLVEALQAVSVLREKLPGWIHAGEASGQLEPLLETAAARLQNEWERNTTRAVALLEPMLILLVSSFVLAIALAVLLPILNMTRAL